MKKDLLGVSGRELEIYDRCGVVAGGGVEVLGAMHSHMLSIGTRVRVGLPPSLYTVMMHSKSSCNKYMATYIHALAYFSTSKYAEYRLRPCVESREKTREKGDSSVH